MVLVHEHSNLWQWSTDRGKESGKTYKYDDEHGGLLPHATWQELDQRIKAVETHPKLI